MIARPTSANIELRPHTWWYLSRATGLVAWVMLALACMWGLLLVTRLLKPADRPAWLLDLHRWLGALAVVATAAHLVTLVADTQLDFGITEIFVPYAPSWHHAPRAWGVTAMYLLAVVECSSLIMKRLPKRLWRRLHLLSYLCFVAATVHGVQAGPDSDNVLFLLGVSAGTTLLAFIVVARLLHSRAKPARVGTTAAAGTQRRSAGLQTDEAASLPSPRSRGSAAESEGRDVRVE
jgi:predicted ferric reductase